MSYTFLLDAGEESSAENFSGIPASVLSKSRSIVGRSCCNGSVTDFCHASPYGMTSAPSMAGHGEEWSILLPVDSRARTSASENQTVKASEGPGQDSGPKWQGSFARWARNTSSWKTRQQSLFGGLEPFSETWPEWGMMQDGECWALNTPAAIMQGDGSGALPTPCASDYKGGTDKPQKRNGRLRTHQFKHWNKIHFGLTYPIPEHMEAMMGWPIGWSALRPLAMDNAHQPSPLRSAFSPANSQAQERDSVS